MLNTYAFAATPLSAVAVSLLKLSFERLEEVMNDKSFDSPIFVKDGRFTVRQIETIHDALDFLDEWPKNQRGTLYETAVWACHSGHNGRLSIEAARQGFVGWARSIGILEEVSTAMPWMKTSRSGRGGVPA
jgi:hypothetical protein